MKHLVILGAGGHGRVIADIAKKTDQFMKISFLDDAVTALEGNCKVIGTIGDYGRYLDTASFVVAIGNAQVREKLQHELNAAGAELAVLVHPSAIIGENVKLGVGTVVMAGTVINAGAQIGEGVIINTSSSIDHDCVIGNFVHISVGAHLAGTVTVGERTVVGAGATIINNITVCSGTVIGAGAVVVNSINSYGTYVGVPARKIK